jgi:hypothetical protein
LKKRFIYIIPYKIKEKEGRMGMFLALSNKNTYAGNARQQINEARDNAGKG